jgi:hypothetical protein
MRIAFVLTCVLRVEGLYDDPLMFLDVMGGH